MASEAPRNQGNWPREIPFGLLLGMLVGGIVVGVKLSQIPESEPLRQNPIVNQMAIVISLFVGGGVGGIISLWKQGRPAEIARFLRFLLGAALWLLLLYVSMYLGAWLGERLLGSVGYVIGWCTGAVLFFVVQSRFSPLSGRARPPAPPSL